MRKSHSVTWVELSQQLDLPYLKYLIGRIKIETCKAIDHDEDLADENPVQNSEKYFETLKVVRVSTGNELLTGLLHVLHSEQTDLLVLDSLSLLFQSDFSQYSNETKIFFGSLKELLDEMRRKSKCAVIFTNWIGLTNSKRSNFTAVESCLFFGNVDYHMMVTRDAEPSLL